MTDMNHLDCATCGKRATCVGRYECMTDIEPSCDECCGHGCEDGLCKRIEIEDTDDGGVFYRWSCSCGAEGAWVDKHADALLLGHSHLTFHVEDYYKVSY